MILDSKEQQDILLHALIEAPFPGSSKVPVAAVEIAVRQAHIVQPPTSRPQDAPEAP